LSVWLSVCLFVCHLKRVHKKRLSQSNELWSLLTTNRKCYMGFSQNPFLDT